MSDIKLGLVVDDRARTFRLDHGFDVGDQVIFCLPEQGGREYAVHRVVSLEWLPATDEWGQRTIITLEITELNLLPPEENHAASPE